MKRKRVRIISTGRFFNRISYDISLPIFDGIEHQAKTLGRLICIKEPSYSQRQNVISYDVIFEKDSTMSQISISLLRSIISKFIRTVLFW